MNMIEKAIRNPNYENQRIKNYMIFEKHEKTQNIASMYKNYEDISFSLHSDEIYKLHQDLYASEFNIGNEY